MKDLNTIKPDVTINFTSLYWVSAAILLTVSFMTGGSRVLSSKFEPEYVLELIQKYKVDKYAKLKAL
ncbi:hypothetical protein NQ314_011579 [Rhamnusium bicolor]|uniref:ATP synthase F0 subunit 8 n=1 Tax=Rhamnusium bicolor TaxID=1586634 RepID=A0AAV8XI94_9CUCU|nr:hypothetical protein NQ314_011579 [Rhamnusium bicolor]